MNSTKELDTIFRGGKMVTREGSLKISSNSTGLTGERRLGQRRGEAWAERRIMRLQRLVEGSCRDSGGQLDTALHSLFPSLGHSIRS